MSKVLVDPAALEEAAKWLEVHSSSSVSAEAFAAEALREAIAQPAEAEGSVEMGSDAWMALHLLDRLDVSADEEPRVQQVEEIVRRMGAALSAVTAERDRLREEVERIALENDGHDQRRIRWAEELKQLRAEVERLREAELLLLSVCNDLMRHENADVRMVTCIELNNWLTRRAAMDAKEE